MLALDVYEQGLCACGFPASLTHDKRNAFTFEDDQCPVCAGAARYARMQDHADSEHRKALGNSPRPTEPLPEDGRRTFIRQMSPHEHAMRKAGGRRGRA